MKAPVPEFTCYLLVNKFKLLHKLNLNQYVLSPTFVISSVRFGFRVVQIFLLQDLVLEGAKHLFSLSEKRHFASA